MERTERVVEAWAIAAGEQPATGAEDAVVARLARRRALLIDGASPPPTPEVLATLVRRGAWERRIPVPARHHRAAWWLAAAGVAGLALGAVAMAAAMHGPAVELVFADDGAAITARDLPQAIAHHDRIAAPVLMATRSRPWLGVWTRPLDIAVRGCGSSRGHLVVQVAEGSAAWNAGVRPGDLLLAIGDAPLATASCIAHALARLHPGDAVDLRFFCVGSGCEKRVRVPLGAQYM